MDTEKTVATEVVEQPVQEATEAPAENAAPRAERGAYKTHYAAEICLRQR